MENFQYLPLISYIIITIVIIIHCIMRRRTKDERESKILFQNCDFY